MTVVGINGICSFPLICSTVVLNSPYPKPETSWNPSFCLWQHHTPCFLFHCPLVIYNWSTSSVTFPLDYFLLLLCQVHSYSHCHSLLKGPPTEPTQPLAIHSGLRRMFCVFRGKSYETIFSCTLSKFWMENSNFKKYIKK